MLRAGRAASARFPPRYSASVTRSIRATISTRLHISAHPIKLFRDPARHLRGIPSLSRSNGTLQIDSRLRRSRFPGEPHILRETLVIWPELRRDSRFPDPGKTHREALLAVFPVEGKGPENHRPGTARRALPWKAPGSGTRPSAPRNPMASARSPTAIACGRRHDRLPHFTGSSRSFPKAESST